MKDIVVYRDQNGAVWVSRLGVSGRYWKLGDPADWHEVLIKRAGIVLTEVWRSGPGA